MADLTPWGHEPDRKDMIISWRADVIQPILFQYPKGHEQAGQPWTPPPAAEAYFLIGPREDADRWDVTIDGDTGLLRIESEDADQIPEGTPQRFYISLPDQPESVEHMLTFGEVIRYGDR